MQISGVLQLNHLAWNGEMSPLQQNIVQRSNCRKGNGIKHAQAQWTIAACLYSATNTNLSPFLLD